VLDEPAYGAGLRKWVRKAKGERGGGSYSRVLVAGEDLTRNGGMSTSCPMRRCATAGENFIQRNGELAAVGHGGVPVTQGTYGYGQMTDSRAAFSLAMKVE
jgi:hypothetical protein